MKTAFRLWPLALLVVLSACGDSQTRCSKGVAEMKGQLTGVVGSKEHKGADSRIVQASTRLDIAQTQLVTGNFAGCLASLDEARTLLKPIK